MKRRGPWTKKVGGSRLLQNPLVSLALTVIVAACNMDEDRFEQIKKLRGVGATLTPPVSTPSLPGAAPRTVDVTFYVAVPLGQEVTFESYDDPQIRPEQRLALTLDPSSLRYEDHAALRLVSLAGRLTVPEVTRVLIPPKPGFARFQYSTLFRVGDEEEKMVGTLLLYPPGAPELGWKAPTVESVLPSGGNLPQGEVELKASLVAPNPGENLRVGWFVSTGRVRNRRADETIWEEPDSGPQSLMLTVRGLKSGAFAAPKVVDVVVP